MSKNNPMQGDKAVLQWSETPSMRIDIYLMDDNFVEVVPSDHDGTQLGIRFIPLGELPELLAITGLCLSDPEAILEGQVLH